MTTKDYLAELKLALDNLDPKKITKLVGLITQAKTIFVCGNGGSAATASHLACDLNKSVLGKHPLTAKPKFRVICLNDNIPLLTAWGNDSDYKFVFSEQLRGLGQKGDLLIVISASGNSTNILETLKVARKLKLKSFGLLGFDGGQTKQMADDAIVVDSFNYGPVEDVHLVINHLLTEALK